MHHLPQIRQEHTEYIAKLSSTLDEVRLQRGQPVSLSFAQEVSNIVLHGLRLLGSWSGRVRMQSAWKYAHPNMEVQPKEGESLSNYERVIRYNYTKPEYFALAEVLGTVKGLVARLLNATSLLSPVLARCVHDEVRHPAEATVIYHLSATSCTHSLSRSLAVVAVGPRVPPWSDGGVAAACQQEEASHQEGSHHHARYRWRLGCYRWSRRYR